ncbi:MAG: radical SAM protein, partial [Caldisericia bacterium]|nr:radical SAM protein [Caldisericia bacterium]
MSFKPPFFHKFSLFGKYFVFFPISGSLIEVDENLFLNINENFSDPFFVEEKRIWEQHNLEFNTPQNLKSLCLLISQKCNFKCDYCFVNEGKYNEKESLMDKETSFKAVDFLIENSKTKHVEIDFFGGEPLLNWDVVKETIEYGYKKAKENGIRIRFSLTTNGALLNDDRLNFLIENSVSLIISLDGPKEINDIHRKLDNERGTFDLIFEKIKKIKNYEGYYIRGTFTNKTKEIFKTALFFYENGFKNISLEPVILEEENPLCLKEKDIEDIK